MLLCCVDTVGRSRLSFVLNVRESFSLCWTIGSKNSWLVMYEVLWDSLVAGQSRLLLIAGFGLLCGDQQAECVLCQEAVW